MMNKKTIAFVEIVRHRWHNEVVATYVDDSVEVLFEYYPDEISFSEHEFVGLTSDEAHELFIKKDTAYLRS